MSFLHEVTIERTPTGALPVVKPLLGWRVLVPRGGKWGDGVAAQLRALGATPVIAPLINFAGSDDPDRLADELAALQRGEVALVFAHTTRLLTNAANGSMSRTGDRRWQHTPRQSGQ
jgi:hypothetical protein